MKDITGREGIRQIMEDFYTLLLSDHEMRPFFDDVVKSGLDHHFDILVDFWDNMLFYTGAYGRNAMRPHLALHEKRPMSKEHFAAWLSHLQKAIEGRHSGPKAEEMLQKAHQIARLMEMKTSMLFPS